MTSEKLEFALIAVSYSETEIVGKHHLSSISWLAWSVTTGTATSMGVGARRPIKPNSCNVVLLLTRQASSNAAIPVVALVLPVAALAKTKVGKAIHNLDSVDILRLLVAKRSLDADTDRRPVGNRQLLAVDAVG